MYERETRLGMIGLPQNVDEVADLLVADLKGLHAKKIATMSEKEYYDVYAEVATFIIDEFRIWTGNEALLKSCFELQDVQSETFDPAMVILKKVREKIIDAMNAVTFH